MTVCNSSLGIEYQLEGTSGSKPRDRANLSKDAFMLSACHSNATNK